MAARGAMRGAHPWAPATLNHDADRGTATRADGEVAAGAQVRPTALLVLGNPPSRCPGNAGGVELLLESGQIGGDERVELA